MRDRADNERDSDINTASYQAENLCINIPSRARKCKAAVYSVINNPFNK